MLQRWLAAKDSPRVQRLAAAALWWPLQLATVARGDWGDEATNAFMQANAKYSGGRPDLVFMARDPSAGELAAATELLGAKPSAESTADLLWAVMMQPEFLFVR